MIAFLFLCALLVRSTVLACSCTEPEINVCSWNDDGAMLHTFDPEDMGDGFLSKRGFLQLHIEDPLSDSYVDSKLINLDGTACPDTCRGKHCAESDWSAKAIPAAVACATDMFAKGACAATDEADVYLSDICEPAIGNSTCADNRCCEAETCATLAKDCGCGEVLKRCPNQSLGGGVTYVGVPGLNCCGTLSALIDTERGITVTADEKNVFITPFGKPDEAVQIYWRAEAGFSAGTTLTPTTASITLLVASILIAM